LIAGGDLDPAASMAIDRGEDDEGEAVVVASAKAEAVGESV
jgi:hypothetical protein